MGRRRRGNVKAAIAGSKEVVAELEGNNTAAARYGAREKSSRSGGRPSGNSSSGKGKSLIIAESMQLTGVAAAPKPIVYDMADGRKVGTETYVDRGFSDKIQAIVYNIDGWTWEGQGKTHWFQDGTTSNSASVDTVVGGWMQSAYNSIIREIASHRGRQFAIRDTTLPNAGNFNTLPYWLNQYCTAFCILRCLKSVLESGDFNYTTSLMASAVNQNLPRLIADTMRLYELSVPPMLIRFLDRVCGVKAWDEDSPCYIMGLYNTGASNPPLDLTISANIQTYLTNAETALNTLFAGNASAPATELQQVSNIFAYAYGEPEIPITKGISFDKVEVMMAKSQVSTYDDQTSHLLFSFPNTNVASYGGAIPMLVPKGASGEALHQYFSLLRSPVFSNDALAGVTDAATALPNQIGWWTNTSIHTTRNSEYGLYVQSGVYQNQFMQATGTTTLSAINMTPEAYTWSPEASLELSDYTTDGRVFTGFDRVWVAYNWFYDNTVLLLEQMFLDPLRKSGAAAL